MASKPTSVRFPEELQILITEEMRDHPRPSLAALIEEAVWFFFQSKGKTGAYKSQHLQWHDKLERILSDGTKNQGDGIKSNLDAFVAQITLDEMMSGRPKVANSRS